MSVLKRVPKLTRNSGIDNRLQFFIDNLNSEKYYYMPVGDVPQHPNRNTLVPLGTFLGFFSFTRHIPINGNEISIHDSYGMRFSIPPYNAADGMSAMGMGADPLVYTDEPPAAGSVPLHYYDYVQMANGTQAFDENGRPMNNEQFPTAFGDGENGRGVQSLRPPGQVPPQLQQSRLGAANFVAKSGGRKKTQKHKNRKSKKTQKYKKSKKTK
jgi:hypothetical protein